MTKLNPARLRPAVAATTLLLATSAAAIGMPAPAMAQSPEAGQVDTRPFPRQVEHGDLRFWLHSPQFETLSGNKVTGRAAASFRTGERKTPDGKPEPVLSYGVVRFAARAEIDKADRAVTLSDIQVQSVTFPTQAANEARYKAAIQKSATGMVKVVSLDQLEASIALGQVRSDQSSLTVRNVAPEIHFAFEPTVMVHIDGDPVIRPMSTAGVARVINTRSLIVRAGDAFYLRLGGRWARAARLDAAWALAKSVPASVTAALAEATERKFADPMDKPSDDVGTLLANGRLPAIAVRTRPAELIPVSGQPQFAPIGGVPLAYIANSPADVFLLNDSDWYVLISGRWFSASSAKGPWRYVEPAKLPAVFARIPADSPKSAVLASVPGTPEAREAMIANAIPQTASVSRKAARFEAQYDGTPDFVAISGTKLSYARNAAVPVIRVDATHYYAVSNGVWFTASSPRGPWIVATTVAPAIYTIPVSSPLHYVTYVRVYGYGGDTVYVGYTPGYYGTVVSNNVVVYGSGYACTPWLGSVWYGCPATYGTGAYFGYSAAVGWTFGFGWGYYAASTPGWGPYWPGYYGGTGAYYPVAGAWNVYGQWGSTVVSGTAAAWANPWTGNYGRAVEGGFYNERTGGRGVGQAAVNTNAYTGTTTAAARGVRYNPESGRVVAAEGVAAANPYTGQAGAAERREVYNTNTGRTTSTAGAAGAGPEGAGAAGGFSSQGSGGDVAGAGYVRYDRDTGSVDRGGVVTAGDTVYAGQDGDIYKKTDDGWQQIGRDTNGGNTQRQAYGPQQSGSTRPSGTGSTASANGALDRERFARERSFTGSGREATRNRLDRGAFGNGFSGRVGGERPSMRSFGGGRRPRG